MRRTSSIAKFCSDPIFDNGIRRPQKRRTLTKMVKRNQFWADWKKRQAEKAAKEPTE